MNARSWMTWGVLAAAVIPLACRSPRAGREGDRAGAKQDTATHWVQDARLRELMTELDHLTFTTWPQEIAAERKENIARQTQEALDEACALAQGLATTASEIPDAVSKVKMSEADRRAFMALVETLHGQALRLEETGRTGNQDAMRATLQAIGDTCDSCHARFADFAGPMNGT